MFVYIYIYIHMYICTGPHGAVLRRLGPLARSTGAGTAALRTQILDFGGLDSSRVLILRGGILMSKGNSKEMLSQGILVGIILVGRLGVCIVKGYAQVKRSDDSGIRAPPFETLRSRPAGIDRASSRIQGASALSVRESARSLSFGRIRFPTDQTLAEPNALRSRKENTQAAKPPLCQSTL